MMRHLSVVKLVNVGLSDMQIIRIGKWDKVDTLKNYMTRTFKEIYTKPEPSHNARQRILHIMRVSAFCIFFYYVIFLVWIID